MFTGIIEEQGSLERSDKSHITICAKQSLVRQLDIGTSIAVNGVCLTVEKRTSTGFSVSVMPETLRVTTLGSLKTRQALNLELPLRADSLISGHLVQGHVDGVATIISITKVQDSHIIKFNTSQQLLKYLVPKGSITIDGISLTLVNVTKEYFSVSIIPHTWKITNIHERRTGDSLNLEVDAIAKYVYKFSQMKA